VSLKDSDRRRTTKKLKSCSFVLALPEKCKNEVELRKIQTSICCAKNNQQLRVTDAEGRQRGEEIM